MLKPTWEKIWQTKGDLMPNTVKDQPKNKACRNEITIRWKTTSKMHDITSAPGSNREKNQRWNGTNLEKIRVRTISVKHFYGHCQGSLAVSKTLFFNLTTIVLQHRITCVVSAPPAPLTSRHWGANEVIYIVIIIARLLNCNQCIRAFDPLHLTQAFYFYDVDLFDVFRCVHDSVSIHFYGIYRSGHWPPLIRF